MKGECTFCLAADEEDPDMAVEPRVDVGDDCASDEEPPTCEVLLLLLLLLAVSRG